jgi:peptidoglycan hydrolase-like protein with peptidoglycan-binding domain
MPREPEWALYVRYLVVASRALNGEATLDRRDDGYFGPRTEQLVKDLQAEYGVAVDGICGPHTWTALERALADRGIEDLAL